MFLYLTHINDHNRRYDKFNSGGFSKNKNFFMEKG